MWLAGAAVLMASGAQAGEPDELQCVEAGYTPEEIVEIDDLLSQIDVLSGGENAAMNALGMLVGTSAIDCAETYDWADGEFEAVLYYELGRWMETAIRRHGPLPQGDVVRVDTALAKGDRRSLWAALEEQVNLGIAGEDTELSPENAKAFEEFMLEVGFGIDDTTAEQIGAYLAAMAMQRISARDFAAM